MDDRLFRWFNRAADHSRWLHGPATAYAVWGIALFGALLILAWWDARSSTDAVAAVAAVVWAGAAMIVGALAVQLIGAPIDRARPTVTLPGTHLLVERTTDFSFPSDHGTATAAIAVGLIAAGPLLRRRWYGRVALALAVLMAVDRVYVGAHYPTDVVAGFVLGAAIAAGLARPATRLLSWAGRRLMSTPLRPLVSATPPVG